VIDAAVPGFLSLGQSTARRIGRQSFEAGHQGRTLLVHGPAGAGKQAFVDDLLALAFCTDADASRRPCNACRGCRDGRARSHPDLVLGSPDAWREERSAGESIVASARRWLLGAAGAPVVGERRVVLVDRADRANEQTQNALLKTLEEPTDRHTFILVADEPSRLLPTIRSRCQLLRIGPVPRRELVAFLVDVERLPADQAESLAVISNGLSGAARAYAADGQLLTWRRRVQTELLSLLERGRADRLASVRDLLDETIRLRPTPLAEAATDDEADAPRTPASAQREAALIVVEAWLSLSRDLLVAAAARPELAPSGELAPDVGRIGSRLGTAPMTRMIRLLERIHDGLRENAAPRLALEAAMLTWPQFER
jgi:DNA polymerase-3 subunit delta'